MPSAYAHLKRIDVRYARWDLSQVLMMDPLEDQPICWLYPVNKAKNADGQRRPKAPQCEDPAHANTASTAPNKIAPYLAELMAQYTATGLPPAYLPKDLE